MVFDGHSSCTASNMLMAPPSLHRAASLLRQGCRYRSLWSTGQIRSVLVAIYWNKACYTACLAFKEPEYGSEKLAEYSTLNLRRCQLSRNAILVRGVTAAAASATDSQLGERLPQGSVGSNADSQTSVATVRGTTAEKRKKLQTCDFTTLAACVAELNKLWVPAKVDQARSYTYSGSFLLYT